MKRLTGILLVLTLLIVLAALLLPAEVQARPGVGPTKTPGWNHPGRPTCPEGFADGTQMCTRWRAGRWTCTVCVTAVPIPVVTVPR